MYIARRLPLKYLFIFRFIEALKIYVCIVIELQNGWSLLGLQKFQGAAELLL
jgi:hypothetical protein